ncbi:MAG: hypothetical protein ACJ74C_07925 [Gaiellaceae bacterium]
MTMRLTGTCVLVLSVFAFAMPAYAGNGNGNGKGNAGGSESAPGNSANAPGHEKQDDVAAASAATTTTTAVATTTVAAAATPSEGVKPSNDTAHETHAQAQSNGTKLYGNGHNAGEIAIKNGASGNTVLHGPGNSQPHKADPCGGGHERDVHALKGRHSAACGSNPPAPSSTPNPPVHVNDPPSIVATETKKPTPGDPAPTPQQPSAGGEAPAEQASHSSGAGETEGVLSATEQAADAASLPFTGQDLWIAVLAGIALIAAGLALRQIRTVEALVESGHDHTDSARYAAHSPRSSVGGRSGR